METHSRAIQKIQLMQLLNTDKLQRTDAAACRHKEFAIPMLQISWNCGQSWQHVPWYALNLTLSMCQPFPQKVDTTFHLCFLPFLPHTSFFRQETHASAKVPGPSRNARLEWCHPLAHRDAAGRMRGP